MENMKVFDIDYIDELSEQQVRYLLRSELERNKLLIRRNKFMLFRYEVTDDTMVILMQMPDGTTAHMAFDHYSTEMPELMFNKEQHKYIIDTIRLVLDQPDYPKTGARDFYYKDGTGVCAEYTCLYEKDGTISTIVGEIVDIYQTRERMLSTIHSLNEQIFMTDAIRHSYETMIIFDLRDYSFQVLQGTPEVRAAAAKVQNVLQLGELFCQYYVDPEYAEGFRKFVNEATIADRLEGNRYLSYEYLTRNIGWCRARIIPSETDSVGNFLHAIFTTETASEHHEQLDFLRIAASTDALTGLKNRYSGEREMNQTLARREFGIYALFDCDSFKSINDNLGHPTGDKVLIEVANALTDVFGSELVMRLGGDEFVVFISSRNLIAKAQIDGSEALFAPLRQRLHAIDIPQLKGVRVSLSCGAVLIPAGRDFDLHAIYALADQKLYEAKVTHNGSIVTATMS